MSSLSSSSLSGMSSSLSSLLLPLLSRSWGFNKLSSGASSGVGTEATALHFGWGAWHMTQGPGLLPSSLKVHLLQIQVDGAMAIFTRVVLLCAPCKNVLCNERCDSCMHRRHSMYLKKSSTDSYIHVGTCVGDTIPWHDTNSKKMTDITECCQRVGPTLRTYRGQTNVSVIWVVEPTDTNPNIASQSFNLSKWETWISLSFSGNAWRRLICSTHLFFLSGLTQTPSVCWIAGAIGSKMGLTWKSTGHRFCPSTCVPGRETLLIGAQMTMVWQAWGGLRYFLQFHVVLILKSVLMRNLVSSVNMNWEGVLI